MLVFAAGAASGFSTTAEDGPAGLMLLGRRRTYRPDVFRLV